MKKLFYLFVSLSLIMASCSSDDDGGSGGSAAEGNVQAKVNGSDFASMTMASFGTLVEAEGSSSLIVQGSDADGNAINLNINSVYEGPGTYEIDGSNGNILITASYTEVDVDVSNPANSQSTSWVAPFDDNGVVGEINVSEDGEYIKGTFSFEARNQEDDNDTVNITSGSFNVKKQEF
jgi:hypothetical protein